MTLIDNMKRALGRLWSSISQAHTRHTTSDHRAIPYTMPNQEPERIPNQTKALIMASIESGEAALHRALDESRGHGGNSETSLVKTIQKLEALKQSWSAISENMGEMCDVVNLMHTCYSGTGDDNILIEGIQLGRKVLSACPSEHPDRVRLGLGLALLLWTRSTSTGDDELLAEAIGFEREALVLRPPGHPDRPLSCANLAASLRTRYMRTSVDVLLTEAIDLEREALALCPPGHSNRSSFCVNLATSLWMRYNKSGDDLLLTEAIDLEREALSLCLTPPTT